MSSDVLIRVLSGVEAEARLDELAAILAHAVAHGASVNFMAGLTLADARAFWRDQIPTVLADGRRIIVADDAGKLVGTVVLTFAPQPNGPHRAEITKMLVFATRRRGLGHRLLAAAEAEALAAGRTLLVLDTQTGSEGERLYRECGWIAAGAIPGFALTTGGEPAEATIFYKVVGRG